MTILVLQKSKVGRPKLSYAEKFITTNCSNPECNKEFHVLKSKFKYYFLKGKKFYCNPKCFQTIRSKSRKTILQNCKYCNTEIQVYKFRYDKSKYRNFYCNYKCKSLYKSSMLSRTSRFLTHYRCNQCRNYYPKEECKIYETSDKKYSYPVCPNQYCGNLKMQTRPRHSRLRHKFRKQMKELEEVQQKQQQKKN